MTRDNLLDDLAARLARSFQCKHGRIIAQCMCDAEGEGQQ